MVPAGSLSATVRSRMRRSVATASLLLSVIAVTICGSVRAERIVLAPGGLVANPSSIAVEYAGKATGTRDWLGWVTIGVPKADLGLEVEVERYELNGLRGTALSAQYSLVGNAFSDIAPAVSVGVRDILHEGREGRALFVSATKTVGLSRNQERLLKDVKIHAGLGSSHLDGVFGGVTLKLACGPEAGAEYVRRVLNSSVSIPLMRNGSMRVFTLDGHIFVGGRVQMNW
jgi:hypothetical protein